MPHTPGPWEVGADFLIWGANNRVVAEVVATGDVVADARLIAAAPDLLAALNEMLWYFEDNASGWFATEAVEKAAEAVARATGGT